MIVEEDTKEAYTLAYLHGLPRPFRGRNYREKILALEKALGMPSTEERAMNEKVNKQYLAMSERMWKSRELFEERLALYRKLAPEWERMGFGPVAIHKKILREQERIRGAIDSGVMLDKTPLAG